ncbi:MAG: hypothetical protein EAX96_11290 [Candidatus Lokiarchaeota archaeon]|nr:hypothetical protein [Candidatus Lokiarchaeota archaeon]
MNENKLIPIHNTESYIKNELYEIGGLPGHKFEVIKLTSIDIDEECCPVLRYIVLIKHFLPNGKLDLNHFKMHVFLMYPNL